MQGYYSVVVIFAILGLTAAQWTPDPDCPYPQTTVYRFPYAGNCSKYWECFQGTKYVQVCPVGLEFNAPKMQCDTPELAQCDHNTTAAPTDPTASPEPTGNTPWTPDPLCPFPSDVSIFYNYPGDCSKYYECFRGNKYARQCPSGLWWNQPIEQCDYPSNVTCNNSTTEPTRAPTTRGTTRATNSTPWKPDPLCPYPSTNVTYFHFPGDCTKYYECFAGEKFTRQCPSGLYWHQAIEQCDYEANVPDCRDGTTPPPTTTTPVPPRCPYPSNQITYFPYPGDCNKYYQCSNGYPYVQRCPRNLYWNEKIRQCDYPRNVDC